MSQNLPPELVLIKNKVNQMKKFKRFLPIIYLFIIGAIGVYVFTFTVDTNQEAIVTRFGAYNRTVGAGLNYIIPIFEKEHKVSTKAVMKLEFGFKTLRADVRSEYGRGRREAEQSFMLTGDLNVVDVEWIVQYKINNPREYLFNIRNVESTIKDLSESTMRQIVGDREVNEVLTSGKENIQYEAQKLLQNALSSYKSGIKIQTVKIQEVNPPQAVKPSFNEVNAANQESDQLINEAWKAYNRVIPEAKGKANKMIAEAEGYATKRINEARGNVERFISLEKEFSRSPQVTKKRMYLEAMQEILPKAGSVYVVDPQLKSIVPLLQVKGDSK